MCERGINSCLLFVDLSDADEMVGIVKLKLCEAQWRDSKAELMKGSGYLFLTLTSLSLQYSIHGLIVSFFATKNPLAPTGEEDGQVTPAGSDSWMYFPLPPFPAVTDCINGWREEEGRQPVQRGQRHVFTISYNLDTPLTQIRGLL